MNLDSPFAPELRAHQVGCLRLTQWNATDVLSPFWRLYWNAEPGAEIDCLTQRFALCPDALWILPENVRFSGVLQRPVVHVWLHFSVAPAHSFAASEPVRVTCDDALSALLHDLRDAIENAPPCDPTTRPALHFRVMALLHATFARADVPLRPPLPAPLRAALRTIEAALGPDAPALRRADVDLSMSALARSAALHPSALSRLFKAHLNTSPMAYVRQARVNRAARLLRFSELSVDAISDACGFPNRFYFSRVFSRETGCGPAEFRRRVRGG